LIFELAFGVDASHSFSCPHRRLWFYL